MLQDELDAPIDSITESGGERVPSMTRVKSKRKKNRAKRKSVQQKPTIEELLGESIPHRFIVDLLKPGLCHYRGFNASSAFKNAWCVGEDLHRS